MSNDPFAEDSYDHSSTPSTGGGGGHFHFKLTSPNKAKAAAHSHQRTSSNSNSHSNHNTAFPSFGSPQQQQHSYLVAPASHHHDRTVSEDIDDHMYGSPFAPTDICPACHMPRMSTIQCTVTQLHHGTDLPCETPKKRQNRGFFSRLRESFQSHEAPAANPTDSQPTSAVHKEVPLQQPPPQFTGDGDDRDGEDDTGTSATPSSSPSERGQEDEAGTDVPAAETHHVKTPSGGISLFGIRLGKTKDEKQLQELMDMEEHDRKKMQQDFLTLDMEEMTRQGAEIHKAVRHALKSQAKARLQVEVACKEEFDRLYLERKVGMEEIRREHLLEAKLTHKKEKERKKHAAMATGTAEEQQPASAEVLATAA